MITATPPAAPEAAQGESRAQEPGLLAQSPGAGTQRLRGQCPASDLRTAHLVLRVVVT